MVIKLFWRLLGYTAQSPSRVYVGLVILLIGFTLLPSQPVLATAKMAGAGSACPVPQFSTAESRYVGWYGDAPANTPNPGYNGMPNLTATPIAGGTGVNVTFISEGGASIIRLANVNSNSFATAQSNNDYLYARVTINSGTAPIRLSSTDVNAVSSSSGGVYSVSLVVIDLATSQSTTVYQDRSIPATGINIKNQGSYTMLPSQSYEIRWYVQTGSLLSTTRSMDNPALNFQVAVNCGNTNLAQGQSASQSSTNGVAGASRAVDGNADGNYNNNSVSHTNYEVNPWWQVDLGSKAALASISLWNRTDCCSDRLRNFFVFVADYDMTGKSFGDLVVDNRVWRYSLGTAAPTALNIGVNTTGRYVRVQLAGTENLQLAEVQVFGVPLAGATAVTTDFENGTLGTFTSVAGARISTDAYRGQQAAMLENSGRSMAARRKLKPDTKITVQAWVKGNGTAYVTFGRSDFTEIANVYRSNNSTTWQQVSFTGVVPVGTVDTDLVFRADNGTFLVDNIIWTVEEPQTLEGIYLVEARHSGKCMTVAAGSLNNGGSVQQLSCSPTATEQQWQFAYIGSGYYKIVNRNSGKLLNVNDISLADGANIHQWDDTNGANLQWQPVLQSDGAYQLVAKHSNKCADVYGGPTAEGAPLKQHGCHSGANQRFNLLPLPQTSVTNFEDNTLGIFNAGNNSSLTTDAESGQKAVVVSAVGDSITALQPIRPQAQLNVIAWVKGSGTAEIVFTGNTAQTSPSQVAVNSMTWRQIALSAVAPPATASIAPTYYRLVFRADNSAFLIDNVVVTLNERDTDNDGLLDLVEACSNSGTLNYEFYDGAVAGNSLTNLPIRGALTKGVTADFDVNRLQNQFTPLDASNYGIRYTGYLWVGANGQYTFATNSDDGSLLYLDERLVLNNDGAHPATERSGTLHLYAGLHRFELLYSAYNTPNSLAVQWSGPSFSKLALPFNRLLSCNPTVDSDLDGIPNYRDLDSDDDTIPDALEDAR